MATEMDFDATFFAAPRAPRWPRCRKRHGGSRVAAFISRYRSTRVDSNSCLWQEKTRRRARQLG